jgi:hypothetical protein
MAQHYATRHRATALPDTVLQEAIEALQRFADQHQTAPEALLLASNPAFLQARQALQRLVDQYQARPFI